VIILSELDPDLKKKQAKAIPYATELDRFTITRLELHMKSQHGTRAQKYSDEEGHYDCPLFQVRGNCSHVMAAMLLFAGFLGRRDAGMISY
jgi:hypothetical protein